MLPNLKEEEVLSKKPLLDPAELDNFCPVSNLCLSQKVVKIQLLKSPQRIPNHFQSRFRPSYSTEVTLIALVYALWHKIDVVNPSWHSLTFQWFLIPSLMVFFWGSSGGCDWKA